MMIFLRPLVLCARVEVGPALDEMSSFQVTIDDVLFLLMILLVIMTSLFAGDGDGDAAESNFQDAQAQKPKR